MCWNATKYYILLMRIQCRPFVSQTIFFIKNVFARAIFEIILENDK
jgi:hypothetical protein